MNNHKTPRRAAKARKPNAASQPRPTSTADFKARIAALMRGRDPKRNGDYEAPHMDAVTLLRDAKAREHYELPQSIAKPVRDIMQSWIDRSEGRKR